MTNPIIDKTRHGTGIRKRTKRLILTNTIYIPLRLSANSKAVARVNDNNPVTTIIAGINVSNASREIFFVFVAP